MTPEPFITDLGPLPEHERALLGGRYGVWCFDDRKLKYQVCQTGDDLDALMTAHNIPAERVVRM